MTINNLINQFNSLSWHEPRWLFLVMLPIFIYWVRSIFQNHKTHYADSHLLPWAVVQHKMGIRQHLVSKNSAYIMGWLLLGIAAAGPRLPLQLASAQQPTNLDIMLVVDVSRSMQATDVSPNRLQRAQIEIEELLTRTRGNRVGIIVFAARPHLLTPLTFDMSALRFYLHSLDTLTLPTTGSDVVSALTLAQDELRNSTKPAAIILLSDGDFPASTRIPTKATRRQSSDIPLFILGIGSTEGAAIALQNGQWLQHNGRPVISRLNETGLRSLLAPTGNGDITQQHYSRVTNDDRDWQQLYDHGMARLISTPVKADADHKILWRQLYPWPLFMATLLLYLALVPYRLLTHTRQTENNATTHFPLSHLATSLAKKSLALIFAALLLTLYPVQPVSANTVTTGGITQAYQNYNDKNYLAAIAIYKRLPGYNARLGEAASYYKAEDYAGAIRQFSRAVLDAHTDQQRATALFNLGNSYFQTGNYADAVRTYADVLKYRPTHKNTLHNLQFSRALKKAVDARVQKIKTTTARMGSGPQLAPSDETINNNQSGLLSIDESDNPENPLPLPELANLSSTTLERLIQKGLAQIQLAASSDNAEQNARYQRDQLSFINARLRMTELDDRQNRLWKRLFEMEEGFPAPLAEPREIPGVPAW